MKIFALALLILVFVFASCKTNQTSEAFLDSDGALTTKEITQNRNMTQYEQGGRFWCRTRFGGTFGNEKDKLEGEKKVRDFIWQHWTEKKRGYIKLSCPHIDTSNTTHYFVEPNVKGEWKILRRNIFQASDDKISLDESVIDLVERIENKENRKWILVFKSSDGEIIERLPIWDEKFMSIKFRQATRADLPEIVRMLADDFLGATRERYENPLPESYVKAFEEIEADKSNELVVAVMSEAPAVAGGLSDSLINATDYPVATARGSDITGKIIGSLQITFTPSISFQGGKRASVESVRVDAKYRGRGIGRELMIWAINRAREENCIAMQLTTNADRADAHRFYENLGFKGTHLGMKLYL